AIHGRRGHVEFWDLNFGLSPSFRVFRGYGQFQPDRFKLKSRIQRPDPQSPSPWPLRALAVRQEFAPSARKYVALLHGNLVVILLVKLLHAAAPFSTESTRPGSTSS